MLDAASIVGNALQATVHKVTSEALPTETTTDQLLENILVVLRAILREQATPEQDDKRFPLLLSKVGFGEQWKPILGNRQFVRILTPVSTPIQVSSPIGQFTTTIAPGVWTSIDYLESGYYLDPTAGTNTQAVMIWITNDKPYK